MNKEEILRYMRTNANIADGRILSLVDNAIKEIDDYISPKTLYRIFDCAVTDDSLIVGGYTFKSKHLANNLAGCKRVVLFGATVGVGCDILIRKLSVTDTAKAMAMQATAICKIEEVCDDLERLIEKTHKVKLRTRFSIGYFDLELCEQRKFFSLIELTKRIGITLTDTCEMTPMKSVTAFIGIENDD